jgi:ankyrin repeat protein
LKKGADTESKNNDGETPLIWASREEIVKKLLECGANEKAKNSSGNSFYHHYTEKTRTEIEAFIEDMHEKTANIKPARR